MRSNFTPSEMHMYQAVGCKMFEKFKVEVGDSEAASIFLFCKIKKQIFEFCLGGNCLLKRER